MPHAVSDILEHLSDLPPFPKVTTKLLAMLEDESIAMEDLSRVVSSDPSLVVKVLHLANSPFYMVSKPVESVKEAVIVLGINTIKSITTAAAIQKGVTSVQPRTDAFSMLSYWRHSYATAIAASKLARSHDKYMSDILYVAGLIHDIGKVVIAFYWPEVWRAIDRGVRRGEETYEAAEARVFGRSHMEIGTYLCERWQFSEKIVDAISRIEARDDQSDNQLASVLKTAHDIANKTGFGFPACEDDGPQILEESEELAKIAEDLQTDVEYQLRILDS